jgi:hypothetical protein
VTNLATNIVTVEHPSQLHQLEIESRCDGPIDFAEQKELSSRTGHKRRGTLFGMSIASRLVKDVLPKNSKSD